MLAYRIFDEWIFVLCATTANISQGQRERAPRGAILYVCDGISPYMHARGGFGSIRCESSAESKGTRAYQAQVATCQSVEKNEKKLRRLMRKPMLVGDNKLETRMHQICQMGGESWRIRTSRGGGI